MKDDSVHDADNMDFSEEVQPLDREPETELEVQKPRDIAFDGECNDEVQPLDREPESQPENQPRADRRASQKYKSCVTSLSTLNVTIKPSLLWNRRSPAIGSMEPTEHLYESELSIPKARETSADDGFVALEPPEAATASSNEDF
jgi:hypothetical protein